MSHFSHSGQGDQKVDPRSQLVKQVKVDERTPVHTVASEANMSPSSPSTPVAVPRFDAPDESLPIEQPLYQDERPAEAGWRGLYNRPFRKLYELTKWRLWSWMLLKPSLRERIERSELKLYELTEQMGFTATVVNPKGGSAKTHAIAFLAATCGLATGQAVGVADVNPDEGNVHTRLGVEKTIAMVDLLAGKVRNLVSHESMGELVRKHPIKGLHNIHVIKFSNERPGIRFPEPGQEVIKRWLVAIRTLFHFMFIDKGNSLGSNWSLAADEISDVLLISLVPWQENSASGVKSGLAHLKRVFPGIATRCVIIVNGHRGRITPQVVESYAAQFGHPVGKVAVIPYDKYFEPLPMKKGVETSEQEQPVRVIDPRKVRLQTYYAFLNCAIMMARTAEEHKRVIPTHPNQ